MRIPHLLRRFGLTTLSRSTKGPRLDRHGSGDIPFGVAWWIALAVLVTNDHVLKGAGVLPGWVTGKLSDFAGLVVAPPLLAWIARVRSRIGRALCCAAVGLAFALMKTLEPVAAAVMTATDAVGVPWRVVIDPTDLIALAALPLAWRACSRCPVLEIERRITWSQATAVVLGLAACLASGRPATGSFLTPAFALNATSAPIDLRIRFFEGAIDCEALRNRFEEEVPRVVSREGFGPGTTFKLQAGDTIPLSRVAVQNAAGNQTPGADAPQCEIVLLQADGLPDAIVWWFDLQAISVPYRLAENWGRTAALDAHRVDVVNHPLRTLPRGEVHTAPAILFAPPSDCPAGATFHWSEIEPGLYHLDALDTLPDGCLDLALTSAAEGEAVDMALCAGGADLPLSAGEDVQISLDDTIGEGKRLVITTSANAGFEILSGVHETTLAAALPGARLVPVDCSGGRTSCGAFVSSMAIAGSQSRPTPILLPGDESTWLHSPGITRRVVIGRLEQVVVSREECELERRTLRAGVHVISIQDARGGAP